MRGQQSRGRSIQSTQSWGSDGVYVCVHSDPNCRAFVCGNCGRVCAGVGFNQQSEVSVLKVAQCTGGWGDADTIRVNIAYTVPFIKV